MDLVPLFGRLHPIVLHFPIALIIMAAALEVIRLKWETPFLARLVPFLLLAGAAGALLASGTGWVFAREFYPRPSLGWMLQWHRWLGISTTALAGVAGWLALRSADSTSPRTRWLRHVIIWMTALLVTGTAHLGALMVWGEDYFDLGRM